MEEQQLMLDDHTQPPLAGTEAVENVAVSAIESPSPDAQSQSIQHLLIAEMQQLREDFDTKVKYDESKERLIDTLHQELQSYREGLHFKILRPIFIDLISLYDDMGSVLEATQVKDPSIEKSLLRNLHSFRESTEDILRHYGVELFQVEEPFFTASKQRALKVVPTTDATLDKQIARRVRKGFLYDNRILRPEVVEIYKYTAPS